ncbi:MAG: DNA gyrase C-terminal beta-propeller domain-containing protein, partial [Planctomycetota bacterium]
TPLEAFSRPKKNGIRAILLGEDDEVVSVGLTAPSDTIILDTENGRSIHFDEKAVRSMGRSSRGVRGIKLKEEDALVGMIVADPEAFLLTACEHGHGKRTPIADYPIKGRGGQGVINIRTEGRNGKVVSVALCRDGADAMFVTEGGMIVRTPVSDVSTVGRNTQGVRLVNLKNDDRLVGLEIVRIADLERESEALADAEPAQPKADDGSPEDATDAEDAGEGSGSEGEGEEE